MLEEAEEAQGEVSKTVAMEGVEEKVAVAAVKLPVVVAVPVADMAAAVEAVAGATGATPLLAVEAVAVVT